MQAFFTNFNFWKFLLLLFAVAIAVELLIVVVKVLLVVGIIGGAGYGLYRLGRHVATRKQRRMDKRDAEIVRLEAENARLEKLLHP